MKNLHKRDHKANRKKKKKTEGRQKASHSKLCEAKLFVEVKSKVLVGEVELPSA
jgi:hypothetical protein